MAQDMDIHRFNKQLAPGYSEFIGLEQAAHCRAIQLLTESIFERAQAQKQNGENGGFAGDDAAADAASEASEASRSLEASWVEDGYDCQMEQDLSALEKAVARHLDLKHILPLDTMTRALECMLRGCLSPGIDLGLRSKLSRTCVCIMRKRSLTEVPFGMPWRKIVDILWEVHVDCASGGPYVGRDVRDAHCRNMLTLLCKCRNYLHPEDTAEKIWDAFARRIQIHSADLAFGPLLVLIHILPTRGTAWSGWVPEAATLWRQMDFSPDWDSSFMTIFARLAKHQPNTIDWTEHLPLVYERIPGSMRLPLGSAAPQAPVERRCPAQLVFLESSKMTVSTAVFCVHSLSPARPQALEYFSRLVRLMANFFHPSNGGKWSQFLASFLGHFTSDLAKRVARERMATRAGITERVVGNNQIKPVPELEHRLDTATLERLVDMLLPLVLLGLHAKSNYMTVQCAASARDLAVISPDRVVTALLDTATEALGGAEGTPHRTSAALKMLATLTPVFLDADLLPHGTTYLPQALELSLPGIDANDPSKTEATFRFIAGASARLQLQSYGTRSDDPSGSNGNELDGFLEEYVAQLVDRIFALLDAMEAPPKKNKSASGASSAPMISSFIFSVAMENLFGALSPQTIYSVGERVLQQISGAAKMNALKFYGALVRILSAGMNNAPPGKPHRGSLFIPVLLNQIVEGRGQEQKQGGSVHDDGAADLDHDDQSRLPRGPSMRLKSVRDEGLRLSSLSEEELVWRLRMLAQACRSCNSVSQYYLHVFDAVRLAFQHESRAVYKAGGRLLRGLLEGLTSTRMLFGTGSESAQSGSDGAAYSFEWYVPSSKEWDAAALLVQNCVYEIEHIVYGCSFGRDKPEEKEWVDVYGAQSESMALDRERLFRALRYLHAVQRGGRWLLSGAVPERMEKVNLDAPIKAESMDVAERIRVAKLCLIKPVRGNAGGEIGDAARSRAVQLWDRLHSVMCVLSEQILLRKPDDGLLLYRSLEPFELAHEPFRRSSQGRMTAHAARGYKAAYKPVIAMKARYGEPGGAGRGMPRFIQKLRLEALHDVRLDVMARGGMCSDALFGRIMDHLTIMALNDFPNVRYEARGVLTRALRVAPMRQRRKHIIKVIGELEEAALVIGKTGGPQEKMKAADTQPNGTESVPARKLSSSEVKYEKLMGAADILRSSAASPYIMREWDLFTLIGRSISHSMLAAERADAAIIVGSLFTKLAALARPLNLGSLRLDLSPFVSPGTEDSVKVDPLYNMPRSASRAKLVQRALAESHVQGGSSDVFRGRERYDQLNDYLLAQAGLEQARADKAQESKGEFDRVVGASSTARGVASDAAHWRLQCMVATILYIGLRSDIAPKPSVVQFLCRSVKSEVIALRQVALKSVALLVALSERRREMSVGTENAPCAIAEEDELIKTMKGVLCDSEFMQDFLHKLSLDQADEMGSDGYSDGGYSDNVFAGLSMMSLAKNVDGDACWALVGGRPWPSSWIPRSRDTFGIVRVRLFEALAYSFGDEIVDVFEPVLSKLLKEAALFPGVAEDTCRVTAAETVAGICRGLRTNYLSSASSEQVSSELREQRIERALKWVDMILESLSGQEGMVNGGTFLRLIASSDIEGAVGPELGLRLARRMVGEGATALVELSAPAHLQAKKLRFLHSLIADCPPTHPQGARVASLVASELCKSRELFSHPLKHVREEIARCMSLFSSFSTPASIESFEASCRVIADCLKLPASDLAEAKDGTRASVLGDASSFAAAEENIAQELKKERSRGGETLSRWISVVHWNGDTQRFARYFPLLLPALFASLDEGDKERLSHARLALSLSSQAKFSREIIDQIIAVIHVATQSKRWRIRGGVLPFVQVVSFCRLFSASDAQLHELRDIQLALLRDDQIEVREAACLTLIPSIRDAPQSVVVDVRQSMLQLLRDTEDDMVKTRRRRRVAEAAAPPPNPKAVDPKRIVQRHAAILGLSALVMSSPYDIPDWMPELLLELAKTINNVAPISTSVQKLFADFWRTHRDEWQTHRLKFNDEEREIVSELLISPSYYA